MPKIASKLKMEASGRKASSKKRPDWNRKLTPEEWSRAHIMKFHASKSASYIAEQLGCDERAICVQLYMPHSRGVAAFVGDRELALYAPVEAAEKIKRDNAATAEAYRVSYFRNHAQEHATNAQAAADVAVAALERAREEATAALAAAQIAAAFAAQVLAEDTAAANIIQQ